MTTLHGRWTRTASCGATWRSSFSAGIGMATRHPICRSIGVVAPASADVESAKQVLTDVTWTLGSDVLDELLNVPRSSLGGILGCTVFRDAARRCTGPSENVGHPCEGSLLQMPSSGSNLVSKPVISWMIDKQFETGKFRDDFTNSDQPARNCLARRDAGLWQLKRFRNSAHDNVQFKLVRLWISQF